MNNLPTTLDHRISLIVAHAMMLDEIGQDKSDRSADASHAVHKYLSLVKARTLVYWSALSMKGKHSSKYCDKSNLS